MLQPGRVLGADAGLGFPVLTCKLLPRCCHATAMLQPGQGVGGGLGVPVLTCMHAHAHLPSISNSQETCRHPMDCSPLLNRPPHSTCVPPAAIRVTRPSAGPVPCSYTSDPPNQLDQSAAWKLAQRGRFRRLWPCMAVARLSRSACSVDPLEVCTAWLFRVWSLLHVRPGPPL